MSVKTYFSRCLIGVVMLGLCSSFLLGYAEKPAKKQPALDPAMESILKEIGQKLDEQKVLETDIKENLTLKKSLAEESTRLKTEERLLKNKASDHLINCTGEFEKPQYDQKQKECAADAKRLDAEKIRINKAIKTNSDAELKRFQKAKELTNAYQVLLASIAALKEQAKSQPWKEGQQQCLDKPTQEEMHCCMAHYWDSKALAQCAKIGPTQTPNTPDKTPQKKMPRK